MIPTEIRSNIQCPNREIREFAEHRISLALDRFRGLRKIVVSVEDVNGPKGRPDKICRIVEEFGLADVIVAEVQPEWQRSVARAIGRVARQTDGRTPTGTLGRRTIWPSCMRSIPSCLVVFSHTLTIRRLKAVP